MPFNTLLITLSSGETLYLPAHSLRSRSSSRAPSPTAGYNSDPEAEMRKIRGSEEEVGLQTPRLELGLDDLPASPTTGEPDGSTSLRRKRVVKSANWQDLLKYVFGIG